MTLEIFSPSWFSALGAIIVIDLVLAGDNALVIGLAARNVPVAMQRKVVLWGTFGAIAIRAVLTAGVVYLLKIPGFLVVGGVALIYIGWKLTQDNAGIHEIQAAPSVRGAVQTIVIADAVMGVDNVLAVGGAAQGSMLLVVVGLAVSIPIVVWGSTLVLRWVERFPAIIWLGAGVLGWTAVKMIVTEPLLAPWLSAYPSLRPLMQIVIVGGLVAVPLWRSLLPHHRSFILLPIVAVPWIVAFGWIEQRYGMHFDLVEVWHWDDDLLDLVRWSGWIPLALWLRRRVLERMAAGTPTGNIPD
jgi:YjbE family integral membrane protein